MPHGVTESAVTHPVVLVDGLLDDIRARRLETVEEAVEVVGGQRYGGVHALGDEFQDGAALLVGDTRVGGGRVQHEGGAGLAHRPDGDPAQLLVADIVADLEAQDVAVETQSGLGIGVRQEGMVNGDAHIPHARQSHRARAS